jgi:hypothetical protein
MLAIQTWYRYRKVGIRTFSIADFPNDVKLIVKRMQIQIKEKEHLKLS